MTFRLCSWLFAKIMCLSLLQNPFNEYRLEFYVSAHDTSIPKEFDLSTTVVAKFFETEKELWDICSYLYPS